MHSFFWHSSLQFLFFAAIPIFVALFGTLFGPADKPRHWQSLAPRKARVVYGTTGASPRKAPAEHQIALLASELNK